MKLNSRKQDRQRRHRRVRRKIHGTEDCPRMSVMVSGTNIYVQFIDDDKNSTVAAASTIGVEKNKNLDSAVKLGQRVVEAAGKAGIKKTVVDRGGHKFHGRIKAVVDEVVKAGLLPAGKNDSKAVDAKNKEEQ